ncbi:MAG: glycosyltransferase family 2 protein [Endomicrobium sp.]|nr:glycosyltransferase family 2 protein [Endomicrobium sp.]
MQYELSICIPAYNREKYLKEALDSIINQLDNTNRDKVEICISDNASQDNTKELVESYKLKHPHIIYFRWDKNMGADNNYLKSVEISSGKYCWILGSDDIINCGSIKKIIQELQFQYDIYLCNVKVCNINMKFMYYYKCLKNPIASTVFQFGDNNLIEKYLKAIKNIAGILGYLSSTIFLKAKWDNIKGKDEFIGTAYVHSYILLSILKDKSKLKYICEYLVSYRGYNDNFALEGMQKRILLDLNGIPLLMHKVFNGCIDVNYYAKEILSRHYGLRGHLYFISSLNENNLIEKKMLEIGYTKPYLLLCKSLKYPYLLGKKIKAVLRRFHVCN